MRDLILVIAIVFIALFTAGCMSSNKTKPVNVSYNLNTKSVLKSALETEYVYADLVKYVKTDSVYMEAVSGVQVHSNLAINMVRGSMAEDDDGKLLVDEKYIKDIVTAAHDVEGYVLAAIEKHGNYNDVAIKRAINNYIEGGIQIDRRFLSVKGTPGIKESTGVLVSSFANMSYGMRILKGVATNQPFDTLCEGIICL
jgi:hypothetical protein